ncbi:MAG: hypothetical protein A2W91_01140 [Bacteroidetes bacterium GWF2_38_335]|nr:MAG: hypothetical protein A2W91_01140 [Bacteroidetes bacterium GWF2_38_335]OFY80357.1 MAG: hypothetical protein A2281_17650 [Bacteroidetes bacterium RIFOXYA12_FULL_38_20]HBS88842.1 hypothetical protein [Bacteroidales bacterium]
MTIFIYHFYKYSYSENSSDWGNFGDYLWQYFSMIFSGINLILFYKINKTLSKQNYVLAEVTIKQTAIKGFNEYFNNKFESSDAFDNIENYYSLKRYLKSFEEMNKPFFELENNYEFKLLINKVNWFIDNFSSKENEDNIELMGLKNNLVTQLNIQIKNDIISEK